MKNVIRYAQGDRIICLADDIIGNEKTLTRKVLKELKTIYPDELIDILVRTMIPTKEGRHLSFEATIKATKQSSKLSTSCLLLMSIRDYLYQDDEYSYLTPVIPLVYALQNGYDFALNAYTNKDAFLHRKSSKYAYSLWDNACNAKGSPYTYLGLGCTLGGAYIKRSVGKDIMDRLQDRRLLRDYEYPTVNPIEFGTSCQMVQDLQLDIARASIRSPHMILNINDWDDYPEAMCE